MRFFICFSIVVSLLLMLGCDPGMSIPQVAVENPENDLAVHVKTVHQLIGNSIYSPSLQTTNQSAELVSVTSIELVTSTATYPHEAVHPSMMYPVIVPPGKTKELSAFFPKLRNPVYAEFKAPAALRIHYRIGAKDKMVTVTVVGGRPHED